MKTYTREQIESGFVEWFSQILEHPDAFEEWGDATPEEAAQVSTDYLVELIDRLDDDAR